MNIIFVIPSLSGGGQEKAGMILTNYLSRFHTVSVVCLEAPSERDFQYSSAIYRILIKRSDSSLGKVMVMLKRILQFRKIKKALKPDVTIAFGPTAIILNSLSFGSDQKFSSIRQSFSKLSFNKFLYKQLFSIAGKLVPVHNSINDELLREFDIKNSLFAYNGYDLSELRISSTADCEKEVLPFFNSKVMVHLGRFDVPKCHWQLVKVFDHARKSMPELKLLFIGDVDVSNPVNTEIYNYCVAYLKSKGYKVLAIGDKLSGSSANYDVLMLGYQSNPHKYLSKADLFVFPSAWEGFPNVLVEAMACGLPVISANCATGPQEILQSDTGEEFGILMPVFDHHFVASDQMIELHKQWSATITSLFSDEEKMLDLKMQALRRAEDFDVEIICKKWLDIIENRI